jgi:DNA-binding winged helix-turn-helix (wHTH) protein
MHPVRPMTNTRFLQLAACTIDLLRGVALLPGQTRTLSATEVAVLAALARHPEVLSREALLALVHGPCAGQPRRMDSTMARLRKKVERDPRRPRSLLGVYGYGYRLVVLSRECEAPAPPAPLVGRSGFAQQLRREVSTPGVLLLHGPPGVGKTSTLSNAQGLGRPLWMCDLEGCRGPAAAHQRIAAHLGVPLGEQHPTETLGRALAARGPGVLVLDHPEAALSAAMATAVALCRAACALTVVVASRHVHRHGAVTVLPMPPLDVSSALSVLGAKPSPTTHQLVQRLEGLPLALVLAGALAQAVGHDAVLERLRRGGDLLHPSRDAPRRHRSMHAAIGASIDGLGSSARHALQVVARTSEPATAAELLGPEAPRLLSELADRSLLVHTPEGGRLSWLVRQMLRPCGPRTHKRAA